MYNSTICQNVTYLKCHPKVQLCYHVKSRYRYTGLRIYRETLHNQNRSSSFLIFHIVLVLIYWINAEACSRPVRINAQY